ncbi:MAG: MgtC/SapB family protein [Opitutus sp.]
MLDTFSRLGITLGLGLLVGLQRQRTDARLAGIRTFPLVALLGAVCGLLAQTFGAWVLLGGIVSLALVIAGANLPLLRAAEDSPGVTTEAALLVIFMVAAYLMVGSVAVAIALCGAVAVLLHLKPQMHSLAAKIGDRDFTAIMQFTLISLVILPVLPDQPYGPYHVLNPFRIWLMVVLIVGISLGGYVAYRWAGNRAGAWATGVLGGLISSTATTVSLARRSKVSSESPKRTAFVILIASAVVFFRLAILVGAMEPRFLKAIAAPFAVMASVLGGVGWLGFAPRANEPPWIPEQTNPTELKPAILFGVLFAVVLLAVAAANERFGHGGLYVTAVLSGLTDMDAITLSVTRLVGTGEVETATAWRFIVVAAMANLVFKGGTVAVLGDRRLFHYVATGFGASFLAGLAWLIFRP